VRALVRRIFTVGGTTDEDDIRRARLIMIAGAAMAAYLLAVAMGSVLTGNRWLAVVAFGLAVPAAAAYMLGHSGRLTAAEWTTAGLGACSAVALVLMQGPSAARLGVLHIAVVFLGLVVRPWMAIVQAALGMGLVRGAVLLHLPIPMLPSTTPAWIGSAEQIVFSTALMMTFTRGYRRLHATLVLRTGKLEAAHAELLAARARLEHLVGERTAELERATVELEAFASTVAHDLRAPLRHVRSFLDVFAEDAAALGEARLAPITAVQQSAAKLVTTVETILSSRPSSRHSR
jgi:signal transduction histidine kinase